MSKNLDKKSKSSFDDVLNRVENSKANAVDRKAYLKSKSLRGRKIKAQNQPVDLQENKIDKAIEREETLSAVVMALGLILCLIGGIALGYALYRIAINSSSMFIVKFLLS